MWHVVYSKRARRQLQKMDPGVRRILVAWMAAHIDGCEDPRVHGNGLTAHLSGAWRYRIGGYRVLCEIREAATVVLAIDAGHRSVVDRP